MADPRSHIDDYAGYIDESVYGTTPDSNPAAIGGDLAFEVMELDNRVEVKGSGSAALTFGRKVRGARQFRYKLGFSAWGTAYLKFIEYALGVAAGGGQMTRTMDSFSLVGRKGPSTDYKYCLCNGSIADVTRIMAEMNKALRIEQEGPSMFVELEDTLNFAGLQNVDLSDNSFPPSDPSTDPVMWYGGGPTATQAFKWGTDAAYDNKPTLTEFLQVPKWTLEIRRNLFPVVGRKTGADSAEYHLALNQVPQQALVSLNFTVPATKYGSLPIDDVEHADWADEVVYIEVPVDDTYTLDLRNGKVRIAQHKMMGRDTDMLDVRIDAFNYVSW